MAIKRRPWTRERVEEEATKMGKRLADPDWTPQNMHDKAPLYCERGHYIEQMCHHVARRGCPECRRESVATEFVKALEAEGYTPQFTIDDYVDQYTPMPVTCPHGHSWKVDKASFTAKKSPRRCAECNKAKRQGRKYKRRTKAEAVAELRTLGEEVVGEYVNTKTPVLSRCMKCGYTRKIWPNNYFRGARSCQNCAGRRKKTTAEHAEEVKALDYELAPGQEYVNAHAKLTYKCAHGHEFEMRPSKLLYGHNCPHCANEARSGERSNLYNPELTDAERQDRRKYPEYHEWRKKCMERDGFVCQLTGNRGGSLCVHHLYSYAEYPATKIEPLNGLTMSEEWHKTGEYAYHRHYPNADDITGETFLEWLRWLRSEQPEELEVDRIDRLIAEVERRIPILHAKIALLSA